MRIFALVLILALTATEAALGQPASTPDCNRNLRWHCPPSSDDKLAWKLVTELHRAATNRDERRLKALVNFDGIAGSLQEQSDRLSGWNMAGQPGLVDKRRCAAMRPALPRRLFDHYALVRAVADLTSIGRLHQVDLQSIRGYRPTAARLVVSLPLSVAPNGLEFARVGNQWRLVSALFGEEVPPPPQMICVKRD